MKYSRQELADKMLNQMVDDDLSERERFVAAQELKKIGKYLDEVVDFLEDVVDTSDSGYKSRAAGLLYKMQNKELEEYDDDTISY